MKKITRLFRIEPETVALLLGLTIGLGLAVHQVFFVLALIVVLVAIGEWMFEKTQQCLRDLHLRPRHA